MEDLELLVKGRFSMASSIFYLGFMAGSYPAMFLAQKFHVPHVIFGIVFLWGGCVLAAAGCTNWQGLYAQRFFLGFLEAGVPPVFMMIVGSWYTKAEQVLRIG
jgi:MFS family permease